MKKISKDEFYSISSRASGALAELRESLEELEVGEAIMLEKSDWPNKVGPNVSVNAYYRVGNKTNPTSKRFSCKTLPENRGWAFLRLQ